MASLDRIGALIREHQQELRQLTQSIWEHPELGFQEHFALKAQKELLEKLGYAVQVPYCGLDTAYRVESGTGTHVFAIAAEYDALPELGHGCGHNLICTAAIAAFHALASLIKQEGLDAKAVLLGCPAEEGGGGKVVMAEQQCLEGIDAVMMVHPTWATFPDTGSLALRRLRVEFTGLSAHAGGSPEMGLNALDAVVNLYNGVSMWRQQLPESARVHGIITDGGKMPNIIPDFAASEYYLRAADEEWINKMEQRFHDLVAASALATGTEFKISVKNRPYMSRRPNRNMNERYMQYTGELGMNPQYPDKGGRGSSDFGDFSQRTPGIHPYFGISSTGKMAGHSLAMTEASGTEFAQEQTIKAAIAMAAIGYDFVADPNFRKQVKDSFRGK